MGLEEFKGIPNRERRDEPRGTLDDKGIFVLNRQAFQALGSPGAVKFFYDENEMVIALKPAESRHRNAFRLKGKGRSTTRLIHAKPFYNHHKIRVPCTGVFNGIDIDSEGTMFLKLNDITRIGPRWN